jgi:hypothetical protein
MALAEEKEVVQAFPAQRADEALDEGGRVSPENANATVITGVSRSMGW